MEGHFGFEQMRSQVEFFFQEIGGGGDDVQFGRIGFGEREFSRLFERFTQRLERAVGQVRYHVNLAEPEPRREIGRGQFPDARERDDGLAEESVLRRQYYAFRKAKTRFVEWSIGVDQLVPIVIFAKLITGGYG